MTLGPIVVPSPGGAGVSGSSDSSLTIVGSDGIVNEAKAHAWTAAQTFSLEDAGTNTTLRPAIVKRTTSGTAAAALGVGIDFQLEDAGGTAASSGSIDLIWQDATDASEDGIFVLRAYVGGTVAEVARVAGAAGVGTAIDADCSLSVGRLLMDSRTTDVVFLSHRDMTTTSNYSVLMTAAGLTRVNCASGQSVTISHNTTVRIQVNTTGIGFFAATPVAQQALSGSRGGNAAVASIATALANLGLCTDGTTP